MTPPQRRVVSPSRATDEFAARRLGYKPQSEIEREREQQSRYIDDKTRRATILPTRGLLFYREAAGNGTQVMRRAPVLPSSAITTAVRYPFGAAGRIIGASLWVNAAWATGTAVLQVRVSKSGGSETVYTIADCVIDGATVDGHARTQSAEWLCPVANGISFAKGDEMRVSVSVSSWTGTPDWGAEVLVAYDGLSG